MTLERWAQQNGIRVTGWTICRRVCSILMCMSWVLQSPSNCNADGHVGWDDPPYRLSVEDVPVNCFAKSLVSMSVRLAGPERSGLRLDWELTVQRRIVQRGSSRVSLAGGNPESIKIEFTTPDVAPGVIVESILEVRVLDDTGSVRLRRSVPINVFHSNPFEIEYARIKELNLDFVDPEKSLLPLVGELGLCDYSEKAVNEAASVDVLTVAPMKVWPSSVVHQIENTLKIGGCVLCLGTESARLCLEEDPSNLNGLFTAKGDFGMRLDRRLSVLGLQPVGTCQTQLNRLGGIDVSIRSEKHGWTYIEGCFSMQACNVGGDRVYRSDQGAMVPRFIYCALNLVDEWHDSPSPRYLLAMMLDRLCPRSGLASLDSPTADDQTNKEDQ